MEIAIAAIIPITAVLPIPATVGSAVDSNSTVVVNSGPILIVGWSMDSCDVGKTGIEFLFVVVGITVVVVDCED